SRTALASAIESFYADKQADDLLLLYFSGHGFRDDDRQLLLSSAESGKTRREGRVQVPRASTLTAAEVRGFMERSRAKRQVLILDCCFSGAFAEGLLELEALGGEGRAILTSSAAIETSRAPEDGEGLSVYTRFLVEGIRTGAADRRQRGWLDAEDLHLYTQSRVKELAPSMTPQFFPTRQGHSIRICNVRLVADVAYRQKLQELVEKRGGVISAAGRELLAVLQAQLGLTAAEVERLEAEVLQPFREYESKLQRYRAAVAATLAAAIPPGRLSVLDQEELGELEQRLKLRPGDVAALWQELGVDSMPPAPMDEPSATAAAAAMTATAATAESPPPRRSQTSAPAAQPPTPIQISTQRGWLERKGWLNRWAVETEPITVTGFREELADGVAITMVQIPAGEFLMGSPAKEAGRSDAE
ncbi:MAG: caspase family protein, partial [Cyanobium sp.]